MFRLPGWQGKAESNCCWKCTATHITRRDCSSSAPWRSERVLHWDMLRHWHETGVSRSPIFGAPFFDVSHFQLDWLHVMDLGVTCDFMGNAMLVLADKYPGGSRRMRIQNLYKAMVEYYDRTGADSRLPELTESMLRKSSGAPKLRAKGAEARNLVGFIWEQADQHLCSGDVVESSIRQAAYHLRACYECLENTVFDHDVMSENSRRFCLLYAALEKASRNPMHWRLKPKFHLMQELCEMSPHNPARNWLYRDEDFGGTMAAMARVRGGRASAAVVGRNVLLKFKAKHPLPTV